MKYYENIYTRMFRLQVFFVRRSLYAGIAAQRTIIIFLPRMSHFVFAQCIMISRQKITFIALKRFLTSM